MEGIKIDTIFGLLITIIGSLIFILFSVLGWYLIQLWGNQKEMYKRQNRTNEKLDTLLGEHSRNHMVNK